MINFCEFVMPFSWSTAMVYVPAGRSETSNSTVVAEKSDSYLVVLTVRVGSVVVMLSSTFKVDRFRYLAAYMVDLENRMLVISNNRSGVICVFMFVSVGLYNVLMVLEPVLVCGWVVGISRRQRD